ncbi:hypothetical protein N7499_001263 [Penicillium canescens]|uniref:Uncharacterized protein n=1 Tax=Penicillium canescens TaxID=5083 RepID=A0AAD6I2W7_PENCN|nr:uncharacterized protein N7446_003598 [Penicillium canescens]KAJ6027803.1 hypothetical protein N7460_012620 [Penicillium canescens]KAJ6041086.1 hypothetical protein N7444_009991 [Penicillium canescens]KAJ6066561.1 hypothetical protein N7446_003598 [Penicillium canescens]KAJ6101633.1 hypothetical protein N7499_001263 [Penicillium canescens]KAJ6174094.1 hypothetical protein N7485_006906 [Penicillium canescens]
MYTEHKERKNERRSQLKGLKSGARFHEAGTWIPSNGQSPIVQNPCTALPSVPERRSDRIRFEDLQEEMGRVLGLVTFYKQM